VVVVDDPFVALIFWKASIVIECSSGSFINVIMKNKGFGEFEVNRVRVWNEEVKIAEI
jgi:hypothetical protein